MANTVAIRVEGLSKRYHLGSRPEKYRALRDVIAERLNPWRRAKRRAREEERATLWALKDVSFEVTTSEVIGIVGRNGAGKSTLLKVLSNITEPSSGFAEIHGRVGSLLEVGTGFHPELTGRENTFLNGAILGMSKLEVARKFDDIVAFAEVEPFIDTPVKHYSSGMYLRLAFAVAAHLEPEVLIVDEVLAVGDASFQKKCLGKINAVSREGRTVLLVSHNMAAIQALCTRVILLEHGRLTLSGTPDAVIAHYLQSHGARIGGTLDLTSHPNRITAAASSMLRSIRLLTESDAETLAFQMGERIVIELSLDTGGVAMSNPVIVFVIQKNGTNICILATQFMVKDPFVIQGMTVVRCSWDPGWLAPGVYVLARITLKAFHRGDYIDTIDEVLSFEILPRDVYGTGKVAPKDVVIVGNARWDFSSRPVP